MIIHKLLVLDIGLPIEVSFLFLTTFIVEVILVSVGPYTLIILKLIMFNCISNFSPPYIILLRDFIVFKLYLLSN